MTSSTAGVRSSSAAGTTGERPARPQRRSKRRPLATAADGKLDLSSLMGLVGVATRIVQLRLFQHYFAELGEAGFRPGTLTTLAAIGANPGVRHGALADALVVKRSNLTKLIDALNRAGLVERRDSPDDRRSVGLFLTEEGQRRTDAAMDELVVHDRATTAVLTPAERETLLGLLDRLAGGLAPSTGP